MDRHNFSKTSKLSLWITVFFISTSLMFLTPSGAQAKRPSHSFAKGKRGHDAVAAFKDRMPNIASRYGKKAEKLEETLLKDKDLWVDPAENLLYLCNFDASEAEVPPDPTDAAIPTGPFPLDQTFQLHSLAGASKVIYLDFDGHVTTGTYWNSNFNGGADIVSLPYDFNGNTNSFSDAELSRIQNIWARVAEDFAMYNIDVTTDDPGSEALRRSGPGDQYYGIRVVISPSNSWYGSAGGVAYVGSFDWSSDTPTFVFSNLLGSGNEKYVTDATSHETGHTLGLSHDGKTGGTAYYTGHGNWAPIMGVGYYKAITQWSKGEYAGANNTEDDLAVMLNNGATYRSDDHGDWINNAAMLSGATLEANGIIERIDDMDVFSFQTEAGTISINVDPASLDPNLDILVQILDDGGNVVGDEDPYYILPASINMNLPAGTYYILVDGVGTGNPDTGYTDYASLGQYFISGTIPNIDTLPAAPTNLAANPVSSSQINLNWSDNSSNENGFSIERSLINTGNWAEIGFTAANTTTYADSGLGVNTTYDYRVSAYNAAGSSGYSNKASATTFNVPPQISVLEATPASILDTEFSQLGVTAGGGVLDDASRIDPIYYPADVMGSQSVTLRVEVSDGEAMVSDELTLIVDDADPPPPGVDLLVEDFSSGTLDGWSLYDDGTINGPSKWRIVQTLYGQQLAQHSSIQDSGADSDLAHLGTCLSYDGGMGWTDYRLHFSMRTAADIDTMGVMFRLMDSDNYYRFTWDQKRNQRRLVKNTGGVFSLLAADNVPYVRYQDYQMEIVVQGDQIEIWIDGVRIFDVTDSDHGYGTFGFHTWKNSSAYFDDVRVEDLGGGTFNVPPQIVSVEALPASILDTETSDLSVLANDPDNGPLSGRS